MNSELYDKPFKLPQELIDHIQSMLTTYPNGDGVRRAKFIVKNGELTYQAMKRIKNFFDNYNGRDKQQYELAGGDMMKDFIETSLNRERDAVKRSDKIKTNYSVNPYLGNKPQQTPRMNEGITEEVNEGIKKNALAIIVNTDNKILLLKRADVENIWEPNKWAFVGGTIEEMETPERAVVREIKEETGLNINNFKEKFNVSRNSENVEYVFIAKYDGDPDDINLNFEHTAYGWYYPEEMKFLDVVPNLNDYLNLAFKKY